ncbi:transcription factor SOX-2 isoform 2-T3 [Anomaloglossus baeobatrachus]|uniref:transcription factor SOX-2 isoform X2 n=1 Tax=Anomaloglossus baeobatrachus TaxID=238106 RepID=UPI003F5072A9
MACSTDRRSQEDLGTTQTFWSGTMYSNEPPLDNGKHQSNEQTTMNTTKPSMCNNELKSAELQPAAWTERWRDAAADEQG